MSECICISYFRGYFVSSKYRLENIGNKFCRVFYGPNTMDYILFSFDIKGYWYFSDYFMLISEYRENKIDKILN